jgi:ABC-type phosphate transport system substrate-binding protein
VVVVVNLPGVRDGELRLSDRAVSAIFAGESTRWRDPEVMRTNEGVNVPDLPIIVVHRADTSGTSFNRFGLGLLGCASPLRGRPGGRYPRFVCCRG